MRKNLLPAIFQGSIFQPERAREAFPEKSPRITSGGFAYNKLYKNPFGGFIIKSSLAHIITSGMLFNIPRIYFLQHT